MSGFEWFRAKRNGLAREVAWPLVADLVKIAADWPSLIESLGQTDLLSFGSTLDHPRTLRGDWRVMVIGNHGY